MVCDKVVCERWCVKWKMVCEKWSVTVCERWYVSMMWCQRWCVKASRGPSGGHAHRSSSRRLCVLRLPHERQARPKQRPRTPQLLQKVLCTAPTIWKADAAQAAATYAAAPPEDSLCVLRLPHKRKPRPKQRPCAETLCVLRRQHDNCSPSGGHARRNPSRRHCVVRLTYQSRVWEEVPWWVLLYDMFVTSDVIRSSALMNEMWGLIYDCDS